MGSMKQSFTGIMRYDEELLDICEDGEEDTGCSVFLRLVRHHQFGDMGVLLMGFILNSRRGHVRRRHHECCMAHICRESIASAYISCGYSLPLLYYARVQMSVCASVWVTFLTHLSLLPRSSIGSLPSSGQPPPRTAWPSRWQWPSSSLAPLPTPSSRPTSPR